MKTKNIFLSLFVLAFIGILSTSCSSSLKPLTPSHFNVTPSPLETVGNEVPVTVNGIFPEKWFNSNATVVVTPVLKYAGKEAYGTPYTYQGDKVAGNGIIINRNKGGNMAMNFKYEYEPDMRESELFLRFNAKIKGKPVKLPEVKVADGVVATSTLASALNTDPSDAQDAFQRIIQQQQDANILFLIQQADLRSSELNKSEIAAWKRRVKEAYTDPKQNVDIEVSAYASPDGGLTLNERLAAEREKRTSAYLDSEMKKQDVNTDINAHYTAQDWEGFRQLVEASNLQDKDLVLRVLSMYPDPETREREIKNISFVFQELAETILPQLRRSRLTANIEIIGKSDDEILTLWKSNPSELNIEELLYAATLIDNTPEKEKIYQYVTATYPQDYRAWNNIGTSFYREGDINKAMQAFNRALQVKSQAPEANVNLALLALNENQTDRAEELLGTASGAKNLDQAMALLYLKNGQYAQAVEAFGDVKTNNAALAQLLTNNYNKASETLNAIENPDAITAYLKALIAARTNNFAEVTSNLRTAIDRDSAMKMQAATDLEFAKYRSNAEFMSLMN
ncbi:MAG TPA: tetratricopeptide repeat protein [Dysgonamonadaceae bacterium]|nr:tetratricopeptide repeat protein [Dysgonamonadaceae bacterium]MDD3727093.1 tetratricopeptide repeat protein [Dysgonamonadaceae bacterium]HUI32855.1 tetratricopeptide repeat protein [Dysgonamonadaceae bacterium]